eukprot:12377755-Prorocentrum_lima.AAC.1
MCIRDRYTHQSLRAVLDKDVSQLLVSAAAVESREVREWLNADCCLWVMVHSGKNCLLYTSPSPRDSTSS